MTPDLKKLATPRTDAEESDGWSGDALAVSSDFARTLERECTALLQEVETLREQLSSALKVIENLHRQPTVEDGDTKP